MVSLLNKSTNLIKKELRFIKKINLAIDTYIATATQLQKRIDWLESLRQSTNVKKDIISTRRVLSRLEYKSNINRLNQLEELYLNAIQQLDDEYDKLLLTKIYIQGQTFTQTASQLGYSTDALKKRAVRAIKKLKNIINNKV